MGKLMRATFRWATLVALAFNLLACDDPKQRAMFADADDDFGAATDLDAGVELDAAAMDAGSMDLDVGIETGAADVGVDEQDGVVGDGQVDNRPAWTVLVYMAADNNLEKYAIDDLNEML